MLAILDSIAVRNERGVETVASDDGAVDKVFGEWGDCLTFVGYCACARGEADAEDWEGKRSTLEEGAETLDVD